MKIALALSLAIFLSGCKSDVPQVSTSAPPPPEVTVARVLTRTIIDYREYTGRTAAMESVELRARASGYLIQTPRTDANDKENLKVTADEGKFVKKGDLLFIIDPKPYELSLQESKGALDAAEARLTKANQDLTRSDKLLDSDSTSRAEYDQAVASAADLRGQIETLKATVGRNELDLDYTHVRSPIDGLLGQTLVTAGNLVVTDTTILSTVVSVNPVYVAFDVDERSVLDYRRRMIDGKVKNAREANISVRLGLANEDGFPHEGLINFVNNITDPETGNTRVRATFKNDTGLLSPGLFARIQVPFTGEYEALLVPTKSIGMDQQGRNVMVVNDDNKVSRRAVKLGQIESDMTVITEGVIADERVVAAGLQKIRPGTLVRVTGQPREKPGEESTDVKAPAVSEDVKGKEVGVQN